MTRVCLKRIETVENISWVRGKSPPKLGLTYCFLNKKSDILGGGGRRVYDDKGFDFSFFRNLMDNIILP